MRESIGSTQSYCRAAAFNWKCGGEGDEERIHCHDRGPGSGADECSLQDGVECDGQDAQEEFDGEHGDGEAEFVAESVSEVGVSWAGRGSSRLKWREMGTHIGAQWIGLKQTDGKTTKSPRRCTEQIRRHRKAPLPNLHVVASLTHHNV